MYVETLASTRVLNYCNWSKNHVYNILCYETESAIDKSNDLVLIYFLKVSSILTP